MQLRVIIFVLSLLGFLSATIGGVLYYTSLKQSAVDEAQREAVSHAVSFRNRLTLFLRQQQKPARSLAGLTQIRGAVTNLNSASLAEANHILDHFNESLETEVCYLMDKTGLTIASSNRKAPDSFVGRNFSFRPYFKNALRGIPAIYMALGTASGRRGFYYSHPVYPLSGKAPAGVVVIKASIEPLEEELRRGPEEIVLVTDPHGIVFLSSREDWLFRSVWKLSRDEEQSIAGSRQFGRGPFEWIGLHMMDDEHLTDKAGNEYLVHQMTIGGFPGWKVVYLYSLAAISRKLSDPFFSMTGSIVLSICLLVGVSVWVLYKKASQDIVRRKEAEQAMRHSEMRYRSLYHKTPGLLHSIDLNGRLVSVSDYWVEGLGYSREEVIGRSFTDFLTDSSHRYFEEEVFPRFLKEGSCKNVPYQIIKKDGEPVDVQLSAIAERDDEGRPVRSLAVLVDVTERNRAEEQLRLAQEELKRHSEDLERQVAERTREITGILKHMPSVVYLKDREYRYVLVNSRFEELFGATNEEVKGKTDYEVFPGKIASQFRLNDGKVFSEGRAFQIEEQIPLKDGTHTYLTVKFPLYDETGVPVRLCGIATDITAIKKAQDQLRRLSAGVMAGQEKERSAIARELHDELGQMLTALRMDAVWLRRRIEKLDAKAAERAFSMCNLIDETIDDVRGIAVRLRPGILDDLGLIPALEWFTADFEKRTGITCVFEHFLVPAVNDVVATAAYRITQEALTNVLRHASAKSVAVALRAENGSLILEVEDRGRGFDAERLEDSETLGIAGMRERAALVGGSLVILSQQTVGTRVFCRIPFDGSSGAVQ